MGVRREAVTEAAAHSQAAGLIQYRRGHITVVDRHALERRLCECYSVIKKECDRLLPEEVGGLTSYTAICSPDRTEDGTRTGGNRHRQRTPEGDAPCANHGAGTPHPGSGGS